MRYANDKVRKAFGGAERYGLALAWLERGFREAGLADLEFICTLGADDAKLVAIHRGGFLQRIQSIEGDSPAQALKDVAEAVRL